MTWFRGFAFGCLMATLAGRGQAQVSSPAPAAFPSEKIIKKWLLSGDLRMVAWGAHDALVTRDRHLISDLLMLASRSQVSPERDDDGNRVELSQQQKDERDAIAAVVDVLVQLRANVPEETLQALAPKFGNEIAVLLSRMPGAEAEPLALDFYHSPKVSPLQYVSASLLALSPPPGFAADMLSQVTVRATIFVTNPDAGRFGMGGSVSCGIVSDTPRDGWPAIGQEVLSKEKNDGDDAIVAGTAPIYARRIEMTHYSGDNCHKAFGIYLGPDQRLRLIAEMLGVDPAKIPWSTAPQANIVFQSPEQYESKVLVWVRGEQEKYRATVDALAERGLITASEADDPKTMPRLYLQMNDMRKQAAPLPELSGLPPRVEAHGL